MRSVITLLVAIGLSLQHAVAFASGPFVSLPATAVKVYSDQIPDWIFAIPTELQVCERDRLAAFGRGYWFRTIDLSNGSARTSSLSPTWGAHAFFNSSCDVLRTDGSAWITDGPNASAAGLQALAKALPQNIVARASRDGKQIAYFANGVYYVARPEGRIVHLGEPAKIRDVDLGAPITALEWLPDSTGVIAMVFDTETGLSRLVRVDAKTGATHIVAEHLDGPSLVGSIGISQDGTIYLSLVGTTAPQDADRHQPAANRDLDIFAFDSQRRTFTRVIASPFDDFAPTVVGNTLYWTTGDPHADVVVLPATGGKAHQVAEGGQLQYWSADGRSLAYTVGAHRMADPAIDYDVDIVDLDSQKRPAGPSRRFISGSHEDFTPAWSPDGKWLNFHSHRCTRYVPNYLNKACTDGVYLLRAGDAPANARLISPLGTKEVGPADWSRDGTRIAFSSWNPQGPPDIAELWVITIDPASGKVLGSENLGVPQGLVSARLQYWSPTTDEIAIEDLVGADRHVIWVLDYATRKTRKVQEFTSVTFSGLAWSADGSRILYSALTAGRQQLFEVPKSGGPPRQLSYEQFGDLIFPTVSRDGRWIAASRVLTTRELWRMPLGDPHAAP